MAALLALLSSVMWGTADFMGGTFARRRPAAVIVAVGQFVSCAVIWLLVCATGAWHIGVGVYALWALLASAAGMCGLWAFYTALAQGTMAIVSPIAATGIVVPIIGGLIVGDLPNEFQTVGVLVAIAGLACVILPPRDELAAQQPDMRSQKKSLVLAAVAALMFGLTLLAIAQGSLTSPVMTLAAMRLYSVIGLLGVALILRTSGGIEMRDIPTAGLIGVFDLAANLLFGLASATGQLVVAAVLGSLYPVVTVMLAWRFHGERLRPLQYLGVAAALGGVVLMSIN
jgi:drug/metabolite transporter (DMT)-like permease